MIRWVPVAAAALLGLGMQAEARPGKVVRVERRSSANLGTPRWCTMQVPTLTAGWCFGPQVQPGESIVILGAKDAATLKVRTSTQFQMCAQPASIPIWQVEGELEGDPRNIQAPNVYGGVYGVVDGALDARTSRSITLDQSVSGRPNDQENFGVDRDGDGKPDLAFDRYSCDPSGNPSPNSVGNCYEVWAAGSKSSGGQMKRLRVDIVPSC